MTTETQIRNLQLRFDHLQHQQAQLTARVDEIVRTMNAFTTGVQRDLVTLLQQNGQNIQIKKGEHGQSN